MSLLLGFTVALHGLNRPGGRGLLVFCLGLGVWAGTMLFGVVPETAHIASRLSTCGGFVLAGFLHAAWSLTDRQNYGLVWLAYGIATLSTAVNAIWPGVLYDPMLQQRGAVFWEGMAAAAFGLSFGFAQLWRDGRALHRRLAWVGLINCVGAWTNVWLLSSGNPSPWGLYLMLLSLVLLAGVITHGQDAATRRLQERSFLYLGLTAFLMGGLLFSVMQVLHVGGPQSAGLGVGALFVLVMAALAVEPLRVGLQGWLMRRLSPDRADAPAPGRAGHPRVGRRP